MITFYYLMRRVEARSIVEIKANQPYDYMAIKPYFHPSCKKKLPLDISFSVVKGKRWADIIVLNEAVTHKFFSQRLIDILGQFIDITNKCYPVRIEGSPYNYYCIYNLEEFSFCTDATSMKYRDYNHFVLSNCNVDLFTIRDSNLKILSHKIKQIFEKEKLTNVEFSEIYGITKEECDALGFLVQPQKESCTE